MSEEKFDKVYLSGEGLIEKIEGIPIEETNKYKRFIPKIQEIVGEKEHYDSPHKEARSSYEKLNNYMGTPEFRESSPIEKSAIIADVMFKIENKSEQ